MPAVSQARTPCIAQLARELGYASKPTLLRHLLRIDELGPQIDRELIYPEDWIVFRVTGYRPDLDTPEMVPGSSLLGDLSSLAESISESGGLTPQDLPGAVLSIDDLCRRWSVSRKTIERYRRLGLIARRLDLGGGRRRVVFLRSGVEWFERFNAERLGRAGGFGRLSSDELSRIERHALGYRARLGWSRSQTAARIAQRYGHSHEGVRKALLRIDAGRERAIFDEPGPIGDREGRLALRALGRGIEPGLIAKRSGRTVSGVARAARLARGRLLGQLGLAIGGAELSVLDAQIEEVLGLEPLAQIERVEPERDLARFLGLMRDRVPSVVYEEQCRARAVNLLLQRCGRRAADLGGDQSGGRLLDLIETDLRLVSILKESLLRGQLTLILSSIESRLGGGIDTLSPQRCVHLLLGGIAVASGAINRFDPSHGGRLAAPISMSVNRFVAAQPDVAQPTGEGRASRRIAEGIEIDDWTRLIDPWQRWLLPDPRIGTVLGRLDERDRAVLVLRFGLGDQRPMTREGLSGLLGTSVVHVARFERAAVRNAMRLVRGGVHG